MPSYLVRVIRDRGAPQEFVGIYVANALDQLDALVDAHCATCACEYAQLPTDSMYLSDHAVPGPSRLYEDNAAEPAFFGEQATGDDWYKLFFGDREPVWTPLCDRAWQSEEERHAVIEAARIQLHA